MACQGTGGDKDGQTCRQCGGTGSVKRGSIRQPHFIPEFKKMKPLPSDSFRKELDGEWLEEYPQDYRYIPAREKASPRYIGIDHGIEDSSSVDLFWMHDDLVISYKPGPVAVTAIKLEELLLELVKSGTVDLSFVESMTALSRK